jgi:enoyl-CoA hydratase/carnithine racemase
MLPYTVAGGVAEITIPDVQALSQHDIAAAKELRDAVWEANDDNDVKVIILRAPGRDFCPRVPKAGNGHDLHEQFTLLHDAFYGPHGLYQAVAYPKKVVIIEVQGECAGAGSLLMLYSDLVVASADASLRSPVDDLPASNVVMPIIIMGLHRAKAWTLTGHPLTAEQALACGLVNFVVGRDQLGVKSLEAARTIARMPLDALTSTKLGFNSVADSSGASEDFGLSSFYATARRGLS